MAKARRNPKPARGAAFHESRFEHAALFEFSKVINSSLDLKFILSHVLLTIMGKMLSTRGIALLAHEQRTFKIEMVKGFPPESLGASVNIRKVPRAMFSIGKLSAKQHPWVQFFKERGVVMLLPMFITDTPIGLLAFGGRLGNKKLQKQEETYLRSLANISATAIEKCHTIDELQLVNRKLDRKIQELNTLFDLGKEYGSLLDTEKLIRLLVFSLLGQVGVNRYIICLKQGSDVQVAASRVDGSIPQTEMLKKLFKLKSAMFVSNLLTGDVQDARGVLADLRMALVVPMSIQGENKGLMILGEKLSGQTFLETEFEFLTSVANLAMISLENARLFKEAIERQRLEDELNIAREIQKGLLPQVLPSIPGFEIAAANISSKQVGGDYYDVIPLALDRYVIAIGDVSGKGTPAALLMANIQATIRALVPLNLPLAELTTRVNELMCENTGGSKFVTFFWAIIDVSAKTLTYVNAGHNYPFLLHANGSMDRLDKGGMILGVLKGFAVYEQATVPLASHDLLVLFTDGVSEAMNRQQQEYTEERLEAVLRKLTQSSAQAITDAIYQDILQHTAGAAQSDDITMMVVKVA